MKKPIYPNFQFIKFIWILLLIAGFSGAASAVTFTVISTNDSGAGSFRQAILDANANQGTDTIVFNISSGVQTIRPVTPLPNITDLIIIDGATQPGFSGTPFIVIDGSSVTGSGDVYGLRVTAGNSNLRSIAINNFQNGQALRIDTNGGNTIQGCYIGVDPNGTVRRRNYSGVIIASSNNLIGGTTAVERNVISGSSFDNIVIAGAGSNNRIQGNYIGTNAAGTASLSESSGLGINIFSTGTGNIVGGTEPGAGNLISGNGQTGVNAGGQDTIVQGNRIGTDLTGTLRVANVGIGVSIRGSNILVGGTTVGARNIISGNGGGGVGVSTSNTSSRPRIQGNYIGVDITGRNILPNSFKGIETNGSAIIGGTEPGAGNVISGNGAGGITLSDFGNIGSTVQGNFIGTDSTGTVALGNANGLGFDIRSSNNIIGGTTAAARNVISGNNTAIDIGSGTTAQLTGNIIQGNYIGTDITGTTALPNRGAQAISVTGSNTVIGGATEGAGNIIAYNNGVGVRITGSFGSNTGNSIRRNSFFTNGGLAIDLGASGVTPNDTCDNDTGANNLQNYPILASVISNGTTTSITGSLNSTANATFVIDFFVSPTYDSTNFGEGKTYIGSTNVTTAGSCSADFSATLLYPAAGSQFVTATATDSNGNTSEFSQYVRAIGTSVKPNFDFDGDGRSDISVFRPTNGGWYINQSTNGFIGIAFGQAGDKIVPADYDGDGKTDVAVYRSGIWYLQRSQAGFTGIAFGTAEDIPQPADFDNDGRAELAVFRPSNGTWYVLNLVTNQFSFEQFGQNGDKPVAADYDGDGRADYAVFRNGVWYILRSSQGFIGIQFGEAADKPVPADYDGDGKADVAVFRPSNSTWYLLQSTAGFTGIQFGITTDIPAPADFDGDGKADIAVFRPANGTWYLNRSTAGFTGVQFGATNDIPVPNAFVP
ncbi:MAG: VCBS repeat-containing protein [Acidobacteriota bacterium]|nr:VCBS repeat-containing protein [Acidobacteriota bacterium]